MKTIGNIFLVWRKGNGSRRIPIGKIKKNATEGVRFSYITENVEIAKKDGFALYEGFPDINKEYSENVINIFGQRIVRSERNDLKDFYSFWKVNPEHINDDFYMLAYTQGLLPTDNFEFLADFNPVKNLSFISEISGLSKTKINPSLINVGDILVPKFEPDNLYDSDAVKLFRGEDFIGYVKLIHSRVFRKSKQPFKVTVHHIEKGEYLERVFIHIKAN